MKIILTGNIPSKKNSRINTKSGRSFPSKKYTEWHKDVMKQITPPTIPIILTKEVVCKIFMPTLRRKDLSNAWESVGDLLVDALVLTDDSWQVIPRLVLVAEYRKGAGGCEIDIFQ